MQGKILLVTEASAGVSGLRDASLPSALQVVHVRSPEQACKLLTAHQFSAVVLGIEMLRSEDDPISAHWRVADPNTLPPVLFLLRRDVLADPPLFQVCTEAQLEAHLQHAWHPGALRHVDQACEHTASVLVLSQNPSRRANLESILRFLHVQLEFVSTVQAAQALLTEDEHALVLWDAELSGVMQLKPAAIPMLLLGATQQDPRLAQALQYYPLIECLDSPLLPERLLSKVKLFADMHHFRTELMNLSEKHETLIQRIAQQASAMDRLTVSDVLTQVANRIGFERALKSRLTSAVRYARQVALLLIDIDHFKHINDEFGYRVGDEVLRIVTKRLHEVLRQGDFIARLSGDEFAVILEEIQAPHNAGAIASKIQQCLSEPICFGVHQLRVKVRIGIACFPDTEQTLSPRYQLTDEDVQTIERNADVALLRAKTSGEYTYQYYNQAFNEAHCKMIALERALGFALERGELFLNYQPKVSLQTGKVVGMEVLLRWRHPTFGLVSPAEFIPIAENSELIHEIGAWVLREACRQYRIWCDAGYSALHLAVNLSPRQLIGAKFHALVEDVLRETGVPADHLELELTETSVMVESEETQATLNALDAMGVKISIDDFGTGFSVLGHIKQLPLSCLKIDMDFIRDVTTNASDAMIVKAIIALANNLGMDVVAEGVENAQQVQFLVDHHCHQAQGYFFSRPLDVDAMSDFLRKH